MENEITQIITEEESEENLETEEIQDIESGHLNVIPFHLTRRFIKLAKYVEPEVIEVEASASQNIEVPLKSCPPFETGVKGKFSKYYRQTYRPAWELMPDFKGWLRGVKGEPTRAYCIYCQKTLHAHRLSLLKHTCTIRHQKAAQLHGTPTQHMTNLNVNMDNHDIQTVIVSEESTLTEEDNSSELMQSHIVYTTQEEMEDTDHDIKDDHDQEDDLEECEESTSIEFENSHMKKDNMTDAPPISTHVIDTTRGAPVFGLSVSLYKLVEGRWTYINEGLTDSKGRCSNFFKKGNFTSGRYKLHYDVDRYFEARKQESLFPFIEIVFDSAALTRYHFPLLLGPNSYTTYRSTYDE